MRNNRLALDLPNTSDEVCVCVCVCVCVAHLKTQLQGHFEQRDVGQAVHEGGDLEGILGQFEDVGGGVDVLLDGL